MYHPWGTSVCFHLVIEQLLISGIGSDFHSLSKSSFHLVLKRLFISGDTGDINRVLLRGFNLVIERLFISGDSRVSTETGILSFQSRYRAAFHFRGSSGSAGCFHSSVSISLSSGFSFQGMPCAGLDKTRITPVSISLSSGFSFQVGKELGGACLQGFVSISLSSGFSFQEGDYALLRGVLRCVFQSRYRAASHFRAAATANPRACSTRFNLVIERLLISG